MIRTLITTTVCAALTVGAVGASAQHEPAAGDIKVRGHWTITVKNDDGSIASTQEFENAYTPSSALAAILVERRRVFMWMVQFLTESGSGYGVNNGVLPDTAGGYRLDNLSVAVPRTGAQAGQLVLAGHFRELGGDPTTLRRVSSRLYLCPTTDACDIFTATGLEFSSRDLTLVVPPATAPVPIELAGHQTLEFTVSFSFS